MDWCSVQPSIFLNPRVPGLPFRKKLCFLGAPVCLQHKRHNVAPVPLQRNVSTGLPFVFPEKGSTCGRTWTRASFFLARAPGRLPVRHRKGRPGNLAQNQRPVERAFPGHPFSNSSQESTPNALHVMPFFGEGCTWNAEVPRPALPKTATGNQRAAFPERPPGARTRRLGASEYLSEKQEMTARGTRWYPVD